MNLFRKSKINWFLKRKFRKLNSTSGTPSQYGQDKVVYDLLGKPKFGIFVDIGANDGVTYSNSLFFEQKNWTGVCIELIRSCLKLLMHGIVIALMHVF